jgi:hypothetical protein
MSERKRAGKSYAITFDEELEAMALIKKAMDLLYPAQQNAVLLWAIQRFMSKGHHLHNVDLVIGPGGTGRV